jgi:hypothetical protein
MIVKKHNNLFLFIFLAFLIGMPFFGYSQVIEIEGATFGNNNIPVSSCTIVASDSENGSNILAFKNSDASGNYKLILSKEIKLDSIWLIIRHISYETIRLKIPLKSAKQDFQMSLKMQKLDEVLIKKDRVVTIKGDTITYNVNGLKAKKDYTIEEVINRIPGVSISESGQIKYLDKPISHLYINGLDLLEGGYSIATQGIPADAVKEIDVMKKHHHERIDIGRTETDNVSFNLKIKDDVGLLFGSLKGDAGVPFLTGKLDATPIYFKDKFQNISSGKLNNTGKTLRGIGSDLASGNINVGGLMLEETHIIKVPNINGVAISEKYWLNNDSYAITNDALHKVNDSTTIKWNFNYVNELSKIENNLSSIFLSNNESSNVFNRSRNQLKTERFNAGVNQEINKRNFYLKNNTSYRFANDAGIERVLINTNYLESNYLQNNFQLSNGTSFKTLIGKKNILQSGLLAQYEQNKEELRVTPPVFETLIGNSMGTDATLQDVSVKKINLAGFAQYDFKLFKLEWNLNQNLKYNSFRFDSNLKQISNSTYQSFPLASNFDYQKVSTTTKINTKINIGKAMFSWGLSADYIKLNSIENNNTTLGINDSFLFIQPNISVKYSFNTKWNLGIRYDLNNNISDFSQLYTPVILTSFNAMVQNPNFVNIIRTNSLAPYVNYNNILKSFFLSLKGNLNQNKSDATFANELNSQGFMVTEVIKQPNSLKNYGFTLYLTKGFLGSFKTELTYAYNTSKNQFFFNNQFLNAINRRQNIDFGLSWDKGSWFTLEYKTKLNFGNSQTTSNQISNSILFQNLNLDIYTTNSTRINFGLDSSRTETSVSSTIDKNTLFNMSFYYKPSKKVNISASLINIFDTQFFSTTNSYFNVVNVYQFPLRPRQFTIGFNYSF